MKRYRVLNITFDTRANILNHEIKQEWEPKIKLSWEQNKKNIIEGLIYQFGSDLISEKINNFKELGPAPFSVIAFHNKFLCQARFAYVMGYYYPALTAICALGERILNQLILHLRNYYKSTPEYKNVYRKQSFDNWITSIDTLEAWDILLPDSVKFFRELKIIRDSSIHFKPEIDTNDKDLALKAINKLTEIVNIQFGTFGLQPWYIPNIKGATFVKKQYENVPFVKEIILPNSYLVGYLHTLEYVNNKRIAHDNHNYEAKVISDEEFTELFNNKKIN